jgi:hypothetical protein
LIVCWAAWTVSALCSEIGADCGIDGAAFGAVSHGGVVLVSDGPEALQFESIFAVSSVADSEPGVDLASSGLKMLLFGPSLTVSTVAAFGSEASGITASTTFAPSVFSFAASAATSVACSSLASSARSVEIAFTTFEPVFDA